MIEHIGPDAWETDRRDCVVPIVRQGEGGAGWLDGDRVEQGWLNVKVTETGFTFCGETDHSDSIDVPLTHDEAVSLVLWLMTRLFGTPWERAIPEAQTDD